jgi:hypothetical protein
MPQVRVVVLMTASRNCSKLHVTPTDSIAHDVPSWGRKCVYKHACVRSSCAFRDELHAQASTSKRDRAGPSSAVGATAKGIVSPQGGPDDDILSGRFAVATAVAMPSKPKKMLTDQTPPRPPTQSLSGLLAAIMDMPHAEAVLQGLF